MKKNIHILIACLAFAVPAIASAHALPVAYTPDSSSVSLDAPASVAITFSERVDASASSINVQGPGGIPAAHGGPVHPDGDPRSLSIPVKAAGNGIYTVSWSAVSADDGHFTKGAYAYIVGVGMGSMDMASSSTMNASSEVVTIATTPEAFLMTVELMGNGIIWASIFLFALAVRQLLLTGKFSDEESVVRRGYIWFTYTGIALAIAGGILQLFLKSNELAGLRDITFLATFPIYLATAAGAATLYRVLAVCGVFVAFTVGKNTIMRAARFTWYEIAMALCMCMFAFFRATISHATANPFHPNFSVAVNFFHLIEKDVWAGIALALALLALSPRLRPFLYALIPRAFAMLAFDFGAVSITAAYIVWLHLKSFNNLFTTAWGGAFLELLAMAIPLVAVRFYHVLARLYRPQLFSRLLPATLAAELSIGMLVVYCSSVVIITSPPLSLPPTPVFTTTDQGLAITLQRDQYESGMIMLALSGGSMAVGTPTLLLTDRSVGTPISVDLVQRAAGEYIFPQALIDNAGPYDIAITVQRSSGYDAHASFLLQQGIFDLSPTFASERSFDLFTIFMIVIAIAALGAAALLFPLSSQPAALVIGRRQFTAFDVFGTFIVASFAGGLILGAFHSSALENPFAAECATDGNMWHLMEPMRAGVPVSDQSMEGCMWGMGSFTYMFPDKNEYDYLKGLGSASVTLNTAPKTLVAGQPGMLTVSLKNRDGTPATLFVDMEKLLHVVVISKDETVFAHIHPDDIHSLTKQEIDSSTFTLNYTFPRSGDYLVAVDYAHGIALESKQFTVHVRGESPQAPDPRQYPQTGMFDGYRIFADYQLPLAGQVETFKFTITKNGQPVRLEPYLSAAAHIAIVKNDLSWYLHMHGEVHVPGQPLPSIIVKNGQVLHSMAMMMMPSSFALPVEAHVIFPSAGLYTLWAQFNIGGDIVPSSFTVRVE